MWNGFHSYGSVEDTGRCKALGFFFYNQYMGTDAEDESDKQSSWRGLYSVFCGNETLGMILLHENACGKKTKEQARWCYFFLFFFFILLF